MAWAICSGVTCVSPWPMDKFAMSPLSNLRPCVAFMYSSFGTRPSTSPRSGMPHFAPKPSFNAHSMIGQGDIQVTPLQMAQAMGIIANGGTFYQTRLVQQVQTFDNQVVTAYQVRAKRTLDLSSETLDELRTGMIDVVNGAGGTAHQASLDNVDVAGKTGTAQWGPKNKERTAAWFAGFLPADQPQYAFAALYEGDVDRKVHGGSTAAPMIADVFKEIYKGQNANGVQQRRVREKTEV